MKIKTFLISIWVLILLPTMTYSLFVDTETSVGNSFTASTLQTELTPPSTPISLNITYNEPFASTSFTLKNIGQLDTVNSLSMENITNTLFAEKIEVSVHYNNISQHFNSLPALNITDYLLQTVGQTNTVSLVFSITEADYNETKGESVTFTIKNHARQSGMSFGNGFFDNKTMEITINNPATPSSSSSPSQSQETQEN